MEADVIVMQMLDNEVLKTVSISVATEEVSTFRMNQKVRVPVESVTSFNIWSEDIAIIKCLESDSNAAKVWVELPGTNHERGVGKDDPLDLSVMHLEKITD